MNVALILNAEADISGDDHEHEMRAAVQARQDDLRAVYRANGFHSDPQRSMQILVQDAIDKELDAVVIWGLECISHSGLGKTLDCIQQLIDNEIGIISLREPLIDTTSPNGAVALDVFSALAAFDSRRISNRTRSALARARAAGTALGRPKGAKDSQPRRRASVSQSA